MTVTKKMVLSRLPEYRDQWVTVTSQQDVHDIISDICKSHGYFSSYYDKIAMLFYDTDIEKICDNLYFFCKENIKYREESDSLQTTAVPSGILNRGYGDCKHFASFIGGCLSAITRQTGMPIDWHYCFASYRVDQSTPYHVFVVVDTKDGPIWVDPTPGSADKQPVWVINKKVKNKSAVSAAVGRVSAVGCGCDQNKINGVIGAVTLPSTSYLNFATQQTGTLLPSIPGYPSDLPKLQLTPKGQLQFYNWPLYFSDKTAWGDFAHINADGSAAPITQSFSTSDWLGTWQRIGTKKAITAAQLAQMEADYKVGRAPDSNGDTFVGTWQTVPGAVPLVLGKYFQYDHGNWFQVMRPMDWIKENIAYYIRYYLNRPYNLDALIAFGTGWPEQLQTAIQNSRMSTLLPNINFLAQPTGQKTFWDSFYSIVPIIILGAESIITLGAATPALIAAMAAAKVLLSVAANNVNATGNTALANQTVTNAGGNLAPNTNLPGSVQTDSGSDNTLLLVGGGCLLLLLLFSGEINI